MAEWFQQQASSGSLVLAIPVALIAGLVSFFSPSVIPLLPGYLSYATGLSGADLEHARRGRMLAGSVLFVLGFSVVYVLLGWVSGSVGAWLVTTFTERQSGRARALRGRGAGALTVRTVGVPLNPASLAVAGFVAGARRGAHRPGRR